MPLPSPDVAREPMHTRSIRVQSFARADGLWDVEAELLDLKAYDFPTRRGVHPAGAPVHHMRLRITIDDDCTIVAAQAAYEHAPYEACAAIAPRYAELVGLNLLRGFRREVKARFGRTAGCTHLSELTWVLPTVAVQSMVGRRAGAQASAEPSRRPFQLDGCHALAVSGEVVRTWYPQWFVAPAPEPVREPAETQAASSAEPDFSFSHSTGHT